jgi:FkbM family methyltransferase
MGAKSAARRFAERALSARIYRLEQVPWGVDFALDVTRQAPGFRFETVFDVGANIGQSALEYSEAFPGATIWSFEPFAEAFDELVRVTGRRPNVRCLKLALGAEPGHVTVALRDHHVSNSLLDAVTGTDDGPVETVEVVTLDDFAAEHGIERVDLLKIDTEGFDLEVLRGAERLLSTGAVSFVQVEVGMGRPARTLVPFDDVRVHLARLGYELFGIYVQVPEWTGEARLRFANPVFVHESVA